ncbi:uncharacterized protein LOC127251658 [Andrographis paniculata]|uniref:uncharacterized protein LOC127251658 n=1 Tax=Andrographis paniculata TaxID=175694 RepID=UPI0021E97D5D|nr:uncharacterized protein LOC127251658 [Andrographis paniculata]
MGRALYIGLRLVVTRLLLPIFNSDEELVAFKCVRSGTKQLLYHLLSSAPSRCDLDLLIFILMTKDQRKYTNGGNLTNPCQHLHLHFPYRPVWNHTHLCESTVTLLSTSGRLLIWKQSQGFGNAAFFGGGFMPSQATQTADPAFCRPRFQSGPRDEKILHSPFPSQNCVVQPK